MAEDLVVAALDTMIFLRNVATQIRDVAAGVSDEPAIAQRLRCMAVQCEAEATELFRAVRDRTVTRSKIERAR